jgi:hypothetical protein
VRSSRVFMRREAQTATGSPHREVVSSCGWLVSRCTAHGEPIVRSSHMYVGQEVQAGTIHRQVQPNLCMQPTAICFRRPTLRAPIPLSPSASPSRPLHAASDAVVGHQVPPLRVLSCSGCPTRTARSGSAVCPEVRAGGSPLNRELSESHDRNDLRLIDASCRSDWLPYAASLG